MYSLRKYKAVFTIGLQDAFYARGEGFIWFLCDTLGIFSFMLFWLAAFRDHDVIGGYTLSQMMFYYLGMTWMNVLLVPHPEGCLPYHIRYGSFSNFLIKPLGYIHYNYIHELSWKVIRLLFIIPTTIGVVILFGYSILASIHIEAASLAAFILACLISYTTQYFIRLAIGASAFWLIESDGVRDTYGLIETLFNGELLPITFLPLVMQRMGDVLPFKYFFFFPLNIIMGKATGSAIVEGLAIQGLWLIAIVIGARFIFFRGIRSTKP
jgi:ABC-2 type transport system permease protein